MEIDGIREIIMSDSSGQLDILRRTISQQSKEIDRLNEALSKAEKQKMGLYGEYQKLQYDIRGLPTPGELCTLRLENMEMKQKLAAFETFEVHEESIQKGIM